MPEAPHAEAMRKFSTPVKTPHARYTAKGTIKVPTFLLPTRRFVTVHVVILASCIYCQGGVLQHRRHNHCHGSHHGGVHDDPQGPRGNGSRRRVRQVQDHQRQRRRYPEDLGVGREGSETGGVPYQRHSPISLSLPLLHHLQDTPALGRDGLGDDSSRPWHLLTPNRNILFFA